MTLGTSDENESWMSAVTTNTKMERLEAAWNEPSAESYVWDAIGEFLSSKCDSIDRALGVNARLRNNWRDRKAEKCRNAVYCAMVDHRDYSAIEPAFRFNAVARDIRSYSTDAWPRDERKKMCPRRPGTIEELFWQALTYKNRPLTAEWIERIYKLQKASGLWVQSISVESTGENK